MTIKPIRSNADYDAALGRAKSLMLRTDQNSLDELEVLQALIERWETAHYPLEAVSAAEAIKFRMAQTGMKPRDLVPYLGTKSRVSEILNGQRQLTVDQIRALYQHLGIPIASLIGATKYEAVARPSVASVAAAKELKTLRIMKPKEELPAFIERAAKLAPAVAMLRKTRTHRTNAKTDFGALEAWCAAVLVEAETVRLPTSARSTPTFNDARRLAQLSVLPDWPDRIRNALADLGVILITLHHFPGTFLDGAAISRADGAPIIALTLRHDRLDNFWFTLLHEFAHVSCHLGENVSVILDDLDVKGTEGIEAEADEFARNALIPKIVWDEFVSPEMSLEGLLSIADAAGVHPAIVAGRWRYEYSDYRKFSRLLGRTEVRRNMGS